MKNFIQSLDTNKKSSMTPRIVTLVVTFLAILYFYPRVEDDNLYRFKVGQLWDHGDLVTQDSLVVPPDSVTIKMIEDSIRQHFVYVYTPVSAADFNVQATIDSVDSYLMQSLTTMSTDDIVNSLFTTRLSQLRDNIRHNLSKGYQGKVVQLGPNDDKPERIALTGNIRRFSDDITTTDELLEQIVNSVENQQLPVDVVTSSGVERFLRPNVILNKDISDERFNAEVGLETDARTRILAPGYCIVERGDLVTPQQGRIILMYTQQLIADGKVNQRSSLLTLLGQAIYILLLLSVLVLYTYMYAPRVWERNSNFIFIISLVGAFVVVSAIVSRFLVLGLYLMPIVIVPILVQVFFHARTALWTGVIVALLNAGMSATGLQYFAIQFVGIAAAVFSLRDLTKRSQLLQTSVLVGLAYIAMYVAFQFLTNGAVDSLMGRVVAVLAVNAVLTSVCYVLMSGVERLFGFVSNVTLVELTDVNNPLLRSLSDECPGTFNHVVAVSNLAYDAARQIGADALLTRAGAMYHDIGKLANPMFFTENQHGINPHDGLSPRQSAEIIISHVKEGLKRAEKAGLPQQIRDFISEHHGAGQAKYFYYTYCKQHPDEDVDATPFTYPGPNPRSRETSILMMADAVEAASRSLKEHTPQAIKDLVNKIIDGQIADGLHNDSPLSFHDITMIKEVFIRKLMTMYHSRIAYPDDPNKNRKSPVTSHSGQSSDNETEKR
ncbi:MAG: HDIG domain-containing protein [Muribaculaceae bacterium]|nr:HDIG domain-containing protein [Muribaculaceae bacterium]